MLIPSETSLSSLKVYAGLMCQTPRTQHGDADQIIDILHAIQGCNFAQPNQDHPQDKKHEITILVESGEILLAWRAIRRILLCGKKKPSLKALDGVRNPPL